MKLLVILLLAVGVVLGTLFIVGSGDSNRGRASDGISGPTEQPLVPDPEESQSSPLEPVTVLRSGDLPGATERNTVAVTTSPKKVVRRLRGTLLADGRPMNEGTVEIRIADRTVAIARSNKFGRFEINFVQESEEAQLITIARGFVPLRQPLGFKEVASTENLGNLRLMRALPLLGTVLSPQGRPLPGARVEIGLGIRSAQTVDLETVTDENGEFLFREAPRGQIVITASKAGFGSRLMETSHGSTFPVEIKLRRGHTLKVLAVDDLGQPLRDAQVEVSANDPGAPSQRKRTDAEGRAFFADMGSPMWNVKISKPDHRPAGRPRVMADGSEHVIEVPRWPGITGTVGVPTGRTLPSDTQVFALPSHSPSDRLLGNAGGRPVDAEGRFRVGGLRPGFYRIHVRAKGFAPYDSQPFQIALDGDHEFGQARLEVGGVLELYCSSGDRPTSGVTCDVRTSPPRPGEVWSPMLRRVDSLPKTDFSGRLSFDGLGDTVWVLLKKEGFIPVVRGPLKTRDERQNVLSVPMVAGGVLHGSVLDQLGRVQPGVRIRINEREKQIGIPIFLNSQPDGRYRSIALPEGLYSVETLLGSQGTSVPAETRLVPGKENRLDLRVTRAQ